MNKLSYNDIIYIGSSKPLICRDGNEQYAKSMDLRFETYDKLPTLEPKNCHIIIDIAAGWTTPEDMDMITDFVYKYKGKIGISFRLVDQFEHQRTSHTYLLMQKLAIDKNVPIIGTYDVDYYGLNVQLTLPYPYLKSEEMQKHVTHRIDDSIILTGADVKGIYPTRESLYSLTDNCNSLTSLRHPGYSGKGWSTGKIGSDYLNMLSNYIFMACTTCNESYELLKYIECAEVGCVPVGDIPKSLKSTEAAKYIIEIPKYAMESSDVFDRWFRHTAMKTDFYRYAASYRRVIKELRNKESLKSKLLNYVNR